MMRSVGRRGLVVAVATVVVLIAGTLSVAALTSRGSKQYDQATRGVLGTAEVGDYSAAAVAVGDFDGDGYQDVAFGSPFEDLGTTRDVGLIGVLYGTSNGLSVSGDRTFHQDVGKIPGAAERGDLFGSALATGDFDGDGYDDVAIGVPGEDSGSKIDAGAVVVLYGGRTGLTTTGSATFTQASPGVKGAAEPYDSLGATLAVGDFDDDGHDDLAIGVPGEGSATTVDAGAVLMLPGSARGITATGDILITRDRISGAGSMNDGDLFGWSLAAADFDRDGHDDLAIGAPGRDRGKALAAGGVFVVPGSSRRLDVASSREISQSSRGVSGAAETDDRFGAAVAAGDIDGDGFDDLAVGSPGEAIGRLDAAGMVHVMYGSSTGIETSGGHSLTQDTKDVDGKAEAGDDFGSALAIGDYNDNGRADLVVGSPGEGVGARNGSGMIHVFYGGSKGIKTSTSQSWSPGRENLAGTTETNAGFGRAVAVGDLDGDGRDDVVVGAPGTNAAGQAAAGALLVIRG